MAIRLSASIQQPDEHWRGRAAKAQQSISPQLALLDSTEKQMAGQTDNKLQYVESPGQQNEDSQRMIFISQSADLSEHQSWQHWRDKESEKKPLQN